MYHFLPGAKHPQFTKSNMERRALERPIRLSDHNHVNAAWQSGLVDAFVQLLHSHQHLARQMPHIVHGAHLSGDTLILSFIGLKNKINLLFFIYFS